MFGWQNNNPCVAKKISLSPFSTISTVARMSFLPPLHFSTLGWVAIISGAFAIGLNKGGLTGFGILPVLLFAIVFSPRISTGIVLPLIITGDLGAIVIYRRDVVWKVILRVLPPALAGLVLGYFTMGRVSESAFGPLIGWIILALIALQFLRNWLGEKLDHIFESRGFALVMGVLTGFTTMVANAAGPVSTLYLLSLRLPKWNLIGTSAYLFFFLNLCKIPFSAHLGLTNAYSLTLGVTLAPFVVIGFFLGRHAAGIMPQKIFDWFVLTCSFFGALKLLW
jgi:uncharacterized membrane protein YfcA